MKRVVAISDMFDEIPGNAKYLFSRKAEEFTSEKENIAIETSGGILNISKADMCRVEPVNVFYIHYYEVDDMDFQELVSLGFLKKTSFDKMKEFMHQFKLSAK